MVRPSARLSEPSCEIRVGVSGLCGTTYMFALSRSSTCEAMIEAGAGCMGRQLPARGGSRCQLGRLRARTPVGAESVDANGARRGFPTSMAPHNKTLELTAKGPAGTVSQVALPCVQ